MFFDQDMLTFEDKSYPVEVLPLESFGGDIHEMLPSLPSSVKRYKMHEKTFWGRGYMLWWEVSGEVLLLKTVTRYVPGIKSIVKELKPSIHAKWFAGEITICNIDDVCVVNSKTNNTHNPYKLFPDCSYYNIFELSHLHFKDGTLTNKTKTIIKPDKKNRQAMDKKQKIHEKELKFIFDYRIKEIDRRKEYKERLKDHKKLLKWKIWRDY